MDVQAKLERAAHEAAKQKLFLRLQKMREDLAAAAGQQLSEPDEWADWIVRLRPLRSHTAPPSARMKKLLKTALRTCGFVAEEVRQAKDGPRKPTKSDS